MSQSDYIKHKKIATELKLNKQPAVFDAQSYISYKQFSLENTIKSETVSYSQLIPENKQLIFDIQYDVSNCAKFIVCKNTNTRPNRKLIMGTQSDPYPQMPFVKSETIISCNCELGKRESCSAKKYKCFNKLYQTKFAVCVNVPYK